MQHPVPGLPENKNVPSTGTRNTIRPYSLKELSVIYGVSPPTLRKWLAPFDALIGKRHGYLFTIPQVKQIFLNLGLPGEADQG